jgi:hypothetical protein
MRKISIIILLILFTLIASSCNRQIQETAAPKTKIPNSSPTPMMLESLDAEAALALANKWYERNDDVKSFITTEKISFTFSEKKTVEILLPADKMVVAFAPYVNKTHPCETHYMSGCQGELVEVPVKVLAKKSDGSVLLDQFMKTMPNGFIELWLPRNQEFILTVESMGKRAEGVITTYPDSNTCITTFQLL